MFVSGVSLENTLSTSPLQSLQARNFSTIHAARPAGESVWAMPADIGLVLCRRL